jgi:hypothetical protein
MRKRQKKPLPSGATGTSREAPGLLPALDLRDEEKTSAVLMGRL